MAETQNTRNKIKLLPEHLIDQIKAGEVVERPASLIKELLENSLDAGATQIDIHIVANGMEMIRIDDNGTGMTFEELPFAFGRHATSKIERYDDLFRLHSFGFRGEALASISAVSRLTCSTTPIEKDLKGGKIIINGGKIESHVPYGNYQHGTSLYIKDLFYNTPVRLKFLKSQTSEKNSIQKILHAFILSNYDVEFSLKFDDKDKMIFPKVSADKAIQRVQKIFYKKSLQDQVITFEKEYDGHKVHGYLSTQGTGGYSGKKQFLFANNRFFQDKSLHQTIIRQSEKLWGPGLTGHYIVKYEVPPSKIDVNIHPNKIQVKFQDNSLIYSLTSSAIKECLENLKIETKRQEGTPTEMFSPSFERSHLDHKSWSPQGFPSQQSEPSFSDYTPSNERSENKNKLFSQITYKFYAKQMSETQSIIINTQALFLQFWHENITSQPLLENILSPLLITEPFSIKRGNIDEHLDLFKDIGFELERLEENLLVLRTIPLYLNGTPYLNVLDRLLNLAHAQPGAKKLNTDWIQASLLDLQFEKIEWGPLSDNLINDLFSFFDEESLSRKNIIKYLDDEKLEKFLFR